MVEAQRLLSVRRFPWFLCRGSGFRFIFFQIAFQPSYSWERFDEKSSRRGGVAHGT
jgi:hypothetical protein